MPNQNATPIANAVAVPKVISPSHNTRGKLYVAGSVIAKAAGDTDTHVYRYARVMSGDRIVSVLLRHVALIGASDVDIGLHDIEGGAVVQKDLFADGLTLVTARASPVDVLGSGTNAVSAANADKRIWELLGLSADPKKAYDLTLTFNTGGTATGAIAVSAVLVDGN